MGDGTLQDEGFAFFSMAFGVPSAARRGWFDPLLVKDNPVFVDPFLLDICEEPEFHGASEQVFDHFRILFSILARDARAPVERLLRFPEFAEACLGYTAAGVRGSGSGRSRATAMRAAILGAIRIGLDSPKHFEELALLAPHIGRDLISDITLRILADRFMDYTARISRDLGIPSRTTRLDTFRQGADDIQVSAHVADLPRNPFDPGRRGIVLVPEVVLRELPTINKDAFEDFLADVHMEELRQQFNVTVKRDIKDRILAIANANPRWVRDYTEWEEARGPRPYDFVRDPRSVAATAQAFYQVGLGHPTVAAPVSAQEVLAFVEEIAQVFKLEVEQNLGYTALYRDDACTEPKGEAAVQQLFSAVARGMCKMANVFMTRESNAGGGPVDFVFSTGYKATVLLEVKLMRNGRFWDGIGGQLPAYLRGHDAAAGIVLGVAFTDREVEDRRYSGVGDFAAQVGRELGFRMVGVRVDARPRRDPPSRLPSEVPRPGNR